MTYSGWSSTPAATLDVATLYERHAPEIHDFLARTVHDRATAEDLTQTTFIRLMERGDTVREAEKMRPWLFTVAHNLAVTHVTRRHASDPIDAAFAIASGEKGPEEEAVAADAARLVWDAARSLEPRQYAVLDLSVRRGFSVGEIAEVLEITPAHAAVVVHRAREALAQAIRLLVVVRQRGHCARLAELIPAGTEVLTPDLRASADRHMRRCEVCKEVGEKLTHPAELLGVLPLLSLPLAVHPLSLFPGLAHRAAPLQAGHTGAGAHVGGGAVADVQTVGQRAAHLLSQPAVLAGAAALVVAGIGLGVALHGGGGSHDGGAPAVAGSQQPQGGVQGGAIAVAPPLTPGQAQPVADTRPSTPIRQDDIRYAIDIVVPVDYPLPPAAQPSPPPSTPGPSPAPTLIPTLQVRLPPPLPAAGADVTVYYPPNPPTVVIILPGQQPIPLAASSKLRTF
jgi:RNA polymerase sigma factor (sigma-70 family)